MGRFFTWPSAWAGQQGQCRLRSWSQISRGIFRLVVAVRFRQLTGRESPPRIAFIIWGKHHDHQPRMGSKLEGFVKLDPLAIKMGC